MSGTWVQITASLASLAVGVGVAAGALKSTVGKLASQIDKLETKIDRVEQQLVEARVGLAHLETRIGFNTKH